MTLSYSTCSIIWYRRLLLH